MCEREREERERVCVCVCVLTMTHKTIEDETEEHSDPDRFLGLSPETAELWKTLGDTPDSKALKEEYLRTKGALHRGSMADPVKLCSSFSLKQNTVMLMLKQQRIFQRELRWKHYIRDDTSSPWCEHAACRSCGGGPQEAPTPG